MESREIFNKRRNSLTLAVLPFLFGNVVSTLNIEQNMTEQNKIDQVNQMNLEQLEEFCQNATDEEVGVKGIDGKKLVVSPFDGSQEDVRACVQLTTKPDGTKEIAQVIVGKETDNTMKTLQKGSFNVSNGEVEGKIHITDSNKTHGTFFSNCGEENERRVLGGVKHNGENGNIELYIVSNYIDTNQSKWQKNNDEKRTFNFSTKTDTSKFCSWTEGANLPEVNPELEKLERVEAESEEVEVEKDRNF